MVSKRTNRGFALKGVDGNCVFLPMGIVSRAKKGGGYGKMRRLQSRGRNVDSFDSRHASWEHWVGRPSVGG